jgi:hypothetical protein
VFAAADSALARGYEHALLVRAGDLIGGRIVLSPGGLSPSSLNDQGVLVFTDPSGSAVYTPTALLARTGDTIGALTLAEVVPGHRSSVDDAGRIAFRARYSGSTFDPDALFTPTSVIASWLGSYDGYDLGPLSDPALAGSGRTAFSASICPGGGSCTGSGVFDESGLVVASGTVVDLRTLTAVADPVPNASGALVFYGYSFGGAGIYVWEGAIAKQIESGDLVDGVTLGYTCCPDGLDFTDAGLFASAWSVSGNPDGVLLVGNHAAALPGDTIDGFLLTSIPLSQAPALNEAGTVAFRASSGGADGIFTATNAVLVRGDVVAGEVVDFVDGVALDESGRIAIEVVFAGGARGIVVATPSADDREALLRTASPVRLIQTVDVPADAFDLRFGYRFESASGELTARLDGTSLGTVLASAASEGRARLRVDGALLGRSGVALELVLDGTPGSAVRIDDVLFPALANGDFQTGDLAGWQTDTSSGGSVEIVPEPGAGAGAITMLLTLSSVRLRRRATAPGGRERAAARPLEG